MALLVLDQLHRPKAEERLLLPCASSLIVLFGKKWESFEFREKELPCNENGIKKVMESL